MDSTQRCRDQAAECRRIMKSAPTKDQAQLLGNMSSTWSRLAGQIDRYNQVAREQNRIPRADAASLKQPEPRTSVGGGARQPE